MAWRRPGDKPFSEPMMVSLPTHICVTRPQWVKYCSGNVNQWIHVTIIFWNMHLWQTIWGKTLVFDYLIRKWEIAMVMKKGVHFNNIFRHNSNVIEISFCFHSNEPIATIFRTWYDSCAAITWTTFGSDILTRNGITVKRIFHALQWRHDERDGVSNHQPHDCLLNRLSKRMPCRIHMCHITVTSRWLHDLSVKSRQLYHLFQRLSRLTTKRHQLPHYCPIVRERHQWPMDSRGDRWMPISKGQ